MHSNRIVRVCRMVVLLAVVAPALAPAALGAQEARADTLRLEDALRLARHGNPDLRKAAHEVDRAAGVELARWGAFLPEVSTSGSLVEFSSRTMTARDEFGQPVTREDPATFSATSAWGAVAASITVFDGFRGVNELQAARAESRAGIAFRDMEAVRIESEVRRRFYSALAAEHLVSVEERLLIAAEERLDATEAMVQAGRATPQDALGAEVDLARQEISAERARGGARTALLALSELLGVGGEPTFTVAGEFPDPAPLSAIYAEELVAAALESSPRVRRAEALADRADHAADAARSIRWPAVRLSAALRREISLPDADQLTSFPWNRGVSAGVSASLPLFTGFSASARITGARVEHANAEEDLRKARLALEREVRSALIATELAHRSVRLAERAAELSRRRLDTGQEGFRRGLTTFTELQQLIEQAAQSERTAVRARLEYAAAIATLEESVGRDILPAGGAGESR